MSISAGCCSGTVTSGLCPGSSDIKCCTNNPCSTPFGTGTCKQTSACKDSSVPGYCSGPSDIQCCVAGAPSLAPAPAPAPTAGVYGVDLASAVSTSSFNCLKSSGFNTFTIPRGFRSTGAVDTNVCSNLNNAMAAGITYRDTYMFPCPVINFHLCSLD